MTDVSFLPSNGTQSRACNLWCMRKDTHTHTHKHTRMNTHTHTPTYTHLTTDALHTLTHLHPPISQLMPCARAHTHTLTHTDTHTLTHTDTHTLTHTDTHTYAPTYMHRHAHAPTSTHLTTDALRLQLLGGLQAVAHHFTERDQRDVLA
jgi:hypothetical protein